MFNHWYSASLVQKNETSESDNHQNWSRRRAERWCRYQTSTPYSNEYCITKLESLSSGCTYRISNLPQFNPTTGNQFTMQQPPGNVSYQCPGHTASSPLASGLNNAVSICDNRMEVETRYSPPNESQYITRFSTVEDDRHSHVHRSLPHEVTLTPPAYDAITS